MFNYLNFTNQFGSYLYDDNFQAFLADTFTDLSPYNVLKSDYMRSEILDIDLGFTNDDAVIDEDELIILEPGQPIFSHLNIYLNPDVQYVLPFEISFYDTREAVFKKAGEPTLTKQGDSPILDIPFLIDHYKTDNLVLSIDYDPVKKHINFIQIRDNNIVAHLKL
ncbi:hypothetical protein SAMN05192574_11979 [Mucilaginibacter gossypiicola]|uniref:Uncharacterized protein n=1 Tax=Mucilaginibacter gossypiicola TaxID=551995 RepID=A0A1H8UIY9_9SPHI|nr:hypothetical protein [Mucilaginibacter gossypiicola]SEP02987.1 hypothetical protein SAMN05192574_11979 [Mucilaginibacter gossypiicola]